ncbi:WD40 repeat domain-containing protein [Hydrogenophaga sp. XSHU_21]
MPSLRLKLLIAVNLLVLVVFTAWWSLGAARTPDPVEPGTALARLQGLKADANDVFGTAVALSRDGRTLVVGADLEDGGQPDDASDNSMPGAGAAYVFEKGESGWGEPVYLKAPMPWRGSGFGFAVALSEDAQALAVAAPFETGVVTGAVYLYRRGPDGGWIVADQLRGPDEVNHFGISLSMASSGTAISVGSLRADGRVQAHNYAWRAGRWTPTGVVVANLPAHDGAVPRLALSRDGQRLALGSGASPRVELFGFGIAGWQAEAPARTGEITEAHVAALAMSDDGKTLAVADATGRVDVLSDAAPGGWRTQVHLEGPAGARLGQRVVLSSDGATLAVNAAGDAPSVYVFRRTGSQWRPLTPVQGTGPSGDLFGAAMALSGNGRLLAVGARFGAASPGGLRGALGGGTVPAGAVNLYAPA